MWPAPWPTPAGRSTSSTRTTTSVGVVGPRSWPSPTGRTGISRPRAACTPPAWRSLEKAGHLSDVIGCALALADIRLAQGRLGEALRVLERGLALATGQGGHVLRGAADMHVGISAILLERDDLEGARRHLAEAEALGEENGLPQNRYRSRVAMAAIRQAEGDLDGALELLTEAEHLYVNDFSPDVRPVAAVKARVWIAQGRLSEASGWARESRLSAADELNYVHEYEHITLARLHLSEGVRDRSERATSEATGAPGAPPGSGGRR